MGAGGFLAPLVVFFVMDEKPFVRHHAKQAMLWQLVCWLVSIVVVVAAMLFGVLTAGIGFIIAIPVVLALGIGGAVYAVIAAFKAMNGEYFSYPLLG